MNKFVTKRNILISLNVLFLLIAWNREINLLYGMFSVLAATIIISHILPSHSVRGITATRKMPYTSFEGDELDISVQIENTGRTSRYMVETVDFIPAAEPALQKPITFIGKIGGRKRREYVFSLPCYKRGEYSAGPLRIVSAYPLGISSAESCLRDQPHPLLVYPEMFDIAYFPILSKGSMITTGIEALAKMGGNEDFFGTREYREGDSLRYIHWPSSAKQNKLIVKDFEIRASTQATIILDLHKGSEAGEGKDTTLEYAVKIAASVSKYALDRGHSIQLIGYGTNSHVVSYGKGLNHLSKVLDTLARVRADGNMPYPLAIYRSADMLRNGDTAILLFSGQHTDVNAYLHSLALLRAKRINCICIFMKRNTFLPNADHSFSEAAPLVNEFISLNVPVYFVAKGDRLQEVFGE